MLVLQVSNLTRATSADTSGQFHAPDKSFKLLLKRENGSSFAKIARDKKMNKSSIRTIWKNKDDIIRQGIQTAKFDAKRIV